HLARRRRRRAGRRGGGSGPPSDRRARDGCRAGRRAWPVRGGPGARGGVKDGPLTVMLVAAEASGDDRGAGLARALKRRLGDDVRFVGVGGERMRAEGVESPFDIAELSI